MYRDDTLRSVKLARRESLKKRNSLQSVYTLSSPQCYQLPREAPNKCCHARSRQKRDDLAANVSQPVLDARARNLVGKGPVAPAGRLELTCPSRMDRKRDRVCSVRARRDDAFPGISVVARPGKPSRLALGLAPTSSPGKA